MKLYEIPNYLEKKVRSKNWEKDRFVYFKEGYWTDSRSPCLGAYNMNPSLSHADVWEEYTEEKPKKKYVMYRHWFIDDVDELDCVSSNKKWEDSYYMKYKFLETEIVKEFQL